jgi:hypothetical protein
MLNARYVSTIVYVACKAARTCHESTAIFYVQPAYQVIPENESLVFAVEQAIEMFCHRNVVHASGIFPVADPLYVAVY